MEDLSLLSGEEVHSPHSYLVFLNGSILGVHRRPKRLSEGLRRLRRRGKLGEFISMHLNSTHVCLPPWNSSPSFFLSISGAQLSDGIRDCFAHFIGFLLGFSQSPHFFLFLTVWGNRGVCTLPLMAVVYAVLSL